MRSDVSVHFGYCSVSNSYSDNYTLRLDIRLNLYHPDPLTLEEVELVLAWMKKHHDKARVEGVLKETKTYEERDEELNSRALATLK